MRSALVIGSGPAAAGAALALSEERGIETTIVDLGVHLEPDHRTAVETMAATGPGEWPPEALRLVSSQPVRRAGRTLPEKRSYGSDFPFRDAGQRVGIASDGANDAMVSAAYGGFSNVWGAQIMPFTSPSFDQWPVDYNAMLPYYRAVLEQMPFAGEEDDLSELFPLIAPASPLPRLAPRTARVLDRYARHRDAVRRAGVTIGRARLALDAERCVRCGLCMTGCPYHLIYSSSQTIDRLRRTRGVRYVGDTLAYRIGEDTEGPFVLVRERDGRAERPLRADRIFVACGALGTTRLVLGSLERPPARVTLCESAQFVVPMASQHATPDPRERTELTLNQFNMVVDLDDAGLEVAQIHFYPYNPAYLDALPAVLRSKGGRVLGTELLRRLTVGLGYIPSWASPRIRVALDGHCPNGSLPRIGVSGTEWQTVPMLAEVLSRMRQVAPRLDLWPLVGRLSLSAAGKSYHFGGSFPHRLAGRGQGPAPSTDRVGRLPQWKGVHLVDASVFPVVPATTFTLSVMANANRIATEALGRAGR